MRIIAALMLILCGFSAGWELKRRLSMRVKLLAECEAACTSLEGMIGFECAPLCELLSRIDDSFGLFPASAEHMKKGSDFPSAWESALGKCSAASLLSTSERQAVEEIGRRLGRSGREAEIENLRAAKNRIRKEYDKTSFEYAQKSRVYCVCGLLGGMMCALVLI